MYSVYHQAVYSIAWKMDNIKIPKNFYLHDFSNTSILLYPAIFSPGSAEIWNGL
jgi:hypothetical protein